MSFIDVRRDSDGKLLFRYDPLRQLVEIKERGEKTLVDLAEYGQAARAGTQVYINASSGAEINLTALSA